ncbi:MAG: family 43 glycosylhydrolase [Tannerella sp.]|nr:family 43 glycosylhydrolase [Tannerella sp.]
MKIKLKILFLIWLSGHLAAQSFLNPVIPGDFADPTIIRLNDTCYAVGTSSEWAPHYPVFKSADLINWNYAGPAFATKPAWTKGSFWAPELYVLNGKVYLYYTARRASDGISYIGVATTDQIEKGFEDHGCIIEFGTEAIDAFILEDEGKLYISWKAYGLDARPIELLCAELSADGLQRIGEPFMLLRDDEGIGMEGQIIYKEDGYYYILYSIRNCCGAESDYAVSAARSESLRGPYEKYGRNPILQGDENHVLSCGHGTAVKTPEGRLFYLYHAYLKGPGFFNGRQAFLKELSMDEDRWPCFVTGNNAAIREPVPLKGIEQQPVADFEDNFSGNVIKPEWTWNFTYADLQAEVKEGKLCLTGIAKAGNAYGTALCLRTQKPDYEILTQVEDRKDIFSGLTLYGDKDNLIIFGKENGEVVLKEIRKGEEQVLYQNPALGDVHLKIEVRDGCIASCYWSLDQKNWHSLPAANQQHDVSYLPPWDRAFRPGLIHIGSENTPAEFMYCQLNYKYR